VTPRPSRAARLLSISERTAAHHVQHIYDKIGVSTRGAAALYAIQHGLLGATDGPPE
jgi:DNA-binding CsgD family transcriptional regulator